MNVSSGKNANFVSITIRGVWEVPTTHGPLSQATFGLVLHASRRATEVNAARGPKKQSTCPLARGSKSEEAKQDGQSYPFEDQVHYMSDSGVEEIGATKDTREAVADGVELENTMVDE